MDVKCERCGTEYEFEDDRVTEDGVTVKCSTCGHLFKIRKKSFVLTEPVVAGEGEEQGPGENAWMIRKADGTVLSFKELTTLQKWIVERKVSRGDEISKSGETWKRLGSIAELASFFQVVDQAAAAAGPGMGPAGPGLTVPQTPAAIEEEARAPEPTTQPMTAAPQGGTDTPAQGGTGSMPAAVPPGTPTPAGPVPAAPPAPVAPAAPAAPPAQTAGPGQGPSTGRFENPPHSEPDSWGDQDYASSDDDVVEKWKKRGRRKWFVIVPLLLVVAGVGVWYLAAPESFMEVVRSVIGEADEVPDTARAKLRSGTAHLLHDSAPELEAAAADLHAAVEEVQGKYPRALVALAGVHITRADKLVATIRRIDAQIEALDAKIEPLLPEDGGEPDAAAKKKIAPLHNRKVELQKQRLKIQDGRAEALDEAKRLIDTAAEQAPDLPGHRVAMADYLRVMTGDRQRVESALQAARQAAGAADPGILFVEGAMLAEDPDRLDQAAARLRQVVQQQPERMRARTWLARVLLALGQPAAARAQLEAVLAASPAHQQAKDLLASLEQTAEKAEEEKEEPAEKKDEEQGEQPAGYQGWMARGDALQKRERYREALDAFDAALEHEPGNVEALTAKGYCYLDMGMNLAAVRWFRKALEANPRFAAAIMGIAEAYKYHGDTKNAIVYYQKYLEVRPSGPEANIARRNLDDLK